MEFFFFFFFKNIITIFLILISFFVNIIIYAIYRFFPYFSLVCIHGILWLFLMLCQRHSYLFAKTYFCTYEKSNTWKLNSSGVEFDWNIPGEIGQYHGCLFPGSLCCQAISSHGIDNVGWLCCCFPWGRISTTWQIFCIHLGPLLLIWINFNPSMDK